VITLITGLPGNGKTLYALTWLRDRAEKEGRTVYYSGIKDCMVPGWVELDDATKWVDLPTGSIVLIDEVQRVMRPRQHGTTVPEHVARLETHRHMGVDLVLVTQDPMLLDSNARRLVGQHFHVVRKFGTHMATIHEWTSVKEAAAKSREGSIRHEWRYPKDVFALYKSAELHTHKRRIPMKVWILLSLPFIIGGIVYYTWFHRLSPDVKKAPIRNAFTGDVVNAGGAASAPASKLTRAQYVEQFSPRVAGLAYTAPAYDEVTKPVHAPYPAACVRAHFHDESRSAEYGHSRTGCQCYSQQGTRLEVPSGLCVQIADGGFFVAWQQPSQPVQQTVQPARDPVPVVLSGAVSLSGSGASPMPEPQPEVALPSPGRGKALPKIAGQ